MDPLGRYYGFAEDITSSEGGEWRVGFGASDCFRTRKRETCRALSGEDKLGNAREDSWVTVVLRAGVWRVAKAQGNFEPDARDRLLAISMRQRPEPPHWEYPTVRLDEPLTEGGVAETGGTEVRATDLWVGPIPSNAPGTICQLVAFDAGGDVAYRGEPSYQQAARQEWQRSGGLLGMGIPAGVDAARAEMRCSVFARGGWRAVGRPRLSGSEGVTVLLEWKGQRVLLADSVCAATVEDRSGDVIGRGRAPVRGLWPPGEIAKPGPLRQRVFIPLHLDDPQAVNRVTIDCRLK